VNVDSVATLVGRTAAGALTANTLNLNNGIVSQLVPVLRGEVSYELSNHLGNVLSTISDQKVGVAAVGNSSLIGYYKAVVQTANDYYPFGMMMPGRKFSASSSASYRYGAGNGQEKSTEINEDSYTAEFWQYDSRIGRRWNVDPVVKDDESPYLVYGGNPVVMIDPDGADWYHRNGDKDKNNLVWFDGNGKQEGYTRDKRGTNFWTERNKNGVSIYYGNDKNEVMMSGSPLAEVVVTSPTKVKPRNSLADRAFGWANAAATPEAKQFSHNLIEYRGMRNQGASPSQIKDGGFFPEKDLDAFERWHQAEEDSRATQKFVFLEFPSYFIPVGGVAKFGLRVVKTGATKLITLGAKQVLVKSVENPLILDWIRIAIRNHPAMKSLFMGKAIDYATREAAKKNAILYIAQKFGLIEMGALNKGADIIGKGILKGHWWDFTTFGQAATKFPKYGFDGWLLLY
jgi:hypothetical protein